MKPSLGRRVRAAQDLGGFKSHVDLAKAVDLAGFGEKTLRRVMDEQRTLRPHEAEAIARHCHVPVWFFNVEDLSTAQLSEEAVGAMLSIDRALGARVLQLEDGLDAVNQRLDEVVALLRDQAEAEAAQALDDLGADIDTAEFERAATEAAKRTPRAAS